MWQWPRPSLFTQARRLQQSSTCTWSELDAGSPAGLGEDRDSLAAFLFTWPEGDPSQPALKLPKVCSCAIAAWKAVSLILTQGMPAGCQSCSSQEVLIHSRANDPLSPEITALYAGPNGPDCLVLTMLKPAWAVLSCIHYESMASAGAGAEERFDRKLSSR